MEPENHLFEKETHLPSTSIVFHVHFQGCISSSSTYWLNDAKCNCRNLPWGIPSTSKFMRPPRVVLESSYAISQGLVDVFSKVKEAKFQTTKNPTPQKKMVTKCQNKTQQTQTLQVFFQLHLVTHLLLPFFFGDGS